MKITTTNKYKAETLSVDMRDQDRSFNAVTITVYDDYVSVRVNYDDLVITLPMTLGMKLMETASQELDAISHSESTS
tara:strand:+ start:251 stop:481 length:231 start_codon:yes stop_codon:yes gene_type:complete